MKLILRIIWIFVFVLFFGFALKNNQSVTLQFFWGYEQAGPLVILLLAFFLFGAVLCLLAMLPMIFRTRFALSKNKKIITELEKELDLTRNSNKLPPIPDNAGNL